MNPRVAVVDSGLSNLDSVVRAIEVCGGRPVVARDPDQLHDVTRIVLPGVGSFRDAMTRLADQGLVQALRQRAGEGIPVLGVCLGMQLLATTGEEGGTTPGLDLVPGRVRKLEARPGERIPHIGWNEVRFERSAPVLEGVDEGADFYFVHSYRFDPDEPAAVLARTPYAGGFVSMVQSGRVIGAQFHPEKSSRRGLQLLTNFLAAPC